MAEANNNWWTKVEQSDGNSTRSTKEQFAIDFLNKNRLILPPDRFAKLVEQTTEIVKKRDLKEQEIQSECEKALKELRGEKSILESISNTATILGEKVSRNLDEKLFDTNKKAEQEIKRKLGLTENISLDDCGFSDNGLHGFSKEKGGNYIVSIQEFEQNLKNTPAEHINSRALANYFKYLRSKGNLSPETLIKNFSGATLASLGKLWASGGNKNEGANRFIAKSTLIKNNMQYVVDIVIKLGTPGKFLEQVQSLHSQNEQQTALLLLKENYNSLQSKFKEEMKARLLAKNPKIKDVDANILVEKLLSDVLQYEGIKGLQEIYKKIDDFSKKYGLGLKTGEIKNITDVGYQAKKAGNKYASAKAVYRAKNETNPQSKKQAEAEVKRLEQKRKEIERAEQVNKKTTNSDVEQLISGEQKIDSVVARMRKEDKEFDKEFKAWEKEDGEYQRWDSEWRIQEKEWTRKDGDEEKTTKIKEASSTISHSGGIYNSLNEGEIRTISLDRSTQSADKISIEKTGDIYTIWTNNLSDKGIQLTTEKVPKYIESLRFMERIGLGYFIQNLPQNELTNIIELTSRNMIRVNNQDGTFDEEEKIALLRGFGSLLGVEKSNDIINSKDGQILFDNHFKIKSARDILSSKNIIQDGALNVMALKGALSGNNKQA